ncbi:hypothetical protein FKW77_009522 [Venturia effusa]|uniref:Uncharacterized protein n=1 Tax=Venturia effusa TaxID=50376 RepID=A0A517LEL6_9PEZI|nr:hypothetical protein FKW77_009522 [Venturia effusa]
MKKQQQPLTFLTLPREVRQKILLETYDIKLFVKAWVFVVTNDQKRRRDAQPHRTKDIHATHLIQVLKAAYPELVSEVDYVEKVWMKTFQRLWRTNDWIANIWKEGEMGMDGEVVIELAKEWKQDFAAILATFGKPAAQVMVFEKRVARSMAPNKPPASFSTLARELRQKILSQTYDFTKGHWTYRNHKSNIEDWTRKLHRAVDVAEIKEDIDDVKGSWMSELEGRRREHEEVFESVWARKSPVGRIGSWKMTRYGEAPWVRVHYQLDEVDKIWFEKRGGREAWFGRHAGQIWKSDSVKGRAEIGRPPWQGDRQVSPLANTFEGPWTQGPSGVDWWMNGCPHVPSGWTELEAAADRDIEWLRAEAERFHNGFFPRDNRRRPGTKNKAWKQQQLNKRST